MNFHVFLCISKISLCFYYLEIHNFCFISPSNYWHVGLYIHFHILIFEYDVTLSLNYGATKLCESQYVLRSS